MTNEKDREEAWDVYSAFVFELDGELKDDTKAAEIVARIRSEAVKADREALRAIDAWWRLPNDQRTVVAIEPAMRLVVSILSDDQDPIKHDMDCERELMGEAYPCTCGKPVKEDNRG